MGLGTMILAAVIRNTLGFIHYKEEGKWEKADKLLDMNHIISVANMSAVCYKYHYTIKPFLIVPIIGAMFADLLNTAISTLFLYLLSYHS